MKEKFSLRERKKLQSRQTILDAAALNFEQRGFSETSIADIMKTANLGVGTFYNYFNSKEEVLMELLKNLADEVENAVEEGKASNLSCLGLLEFACTFIAELLDKNRFVLPLFLTASEHSDRPELTPTRSLTPSFKPVFKKILLQGQTDGEVRTDIPVDLIAEMFHSIYQSASFSKFDLPFQDNIKLKTRILIDGLNFPPHREVGDS